MSDKMTITDQSCTYADKNGQQRIVRVVKTQIAQNTDDDIRRLLISLRKIVGQKSSVEVKMMLEKMLDSMI